MRKRKLNTLSGKIVRPTADRLRESIFNIISSLVPDAVVLDLFAGTGALGIEALSRGAKFCVFIDNNRSSIDIIKKNIVICELKNKASILKWDITRSLDCLSPIRHEFDLIFMDPPYNENMVFPAMTQLKQSQRLRQNATIVVEHSSLEKIPDHITCYDVIDERAYGKTVVSILNYHT